MKYSLLLVSLASAAVCQSSGFPSASEFPPCSINCFTSTLENDGCTESDFTCHCAKTGLYSNISTCVFAACNQSEADTFLNGFITSCKGLGITLPGAPTSALEPTEGAATATTTPSSKSAAGKVAVQLGTLAVGVLGVITFL